METMGIDSMKTHKNQYQGSKGQVANYFIRKGFENEMKTDQTLNQIKPDNKKGIYDQYTTT